MQEINLVQCQTTGETKMARFVFGRADLAEYTKELEARWLDNEDNIDIYKTLLIIRWFNEQGRKLALFQDRIVELERENQLLQNDNLSSAGPEVRDLLKDILEDPWLVDLNVTIMPRIQSLIERIS